MNEKQLKAYFDHATVGMARVGLDERLLQANDALCRMLGYSREVLLTMSVADITHPEDREREKEHKLRQQKDAETNFHVEKRYLHADGHTVWGKLSVSLIEDDEGSPLYYIGQLQDITSIKENEQRLQLALEEAERQRARADAILAAIGDPLTIQDTNFRVIYQNAINQEILGNHQGEYCYEAYEGNPEVCEGCGLAKAFADGKVHRAERSVVRNNSTLYFEVTASPLLDTHGRPVAGIEIARNITDRKQKEKLLAEQVQLLSLSSDIGAMLTKARSQKTMLAECCELLAHHLGAALARIWTVNPAGDLLILQASAGLHTNINGPDSHIPIDEKTQIGTIGSTRMPHTTNAVIDDPTLSDQEWAKKEGMVSFAGHPLLIEEHLVGVIGIFFRHPLTDTASRTIASIADEVALGIERLRTEERLRRSNRALRILSRCNEALIHTHSEKELLEKICRIIVEPDGYLMAWVGYAEANTEKTVFPMAQAGFDEGYLHSIHLRWDDSEFGMGPMGTAIRTGKTRIIKDIDTDPDFLPWRADAVQRRYSSIIALPLTDSSSRPFGGLCIYSVEKDAFDAEEIKLLGELAGDLSFGINTLRMQEESWKEQREKRKLQNQLRQAQKLEAIGILAGGIAHDFNNILSAILGFSELAMDEVGPRSKAGKDLQEIITAGKRAADLVRQILTISRQSEHHRKPLKIQNIIKEALKLLRPSISTSIEIKTSVDQKCPDVLADPTEIHQVIMNLCTNAFHAMQEISGGDPVMEIRLAPVAMDQAAVLDLGLNISPGRYAKLSVSDTGVGMDAETRSKIFYPYFTTKRKGQGTGLGLATVHSIVTGSGGDISVASTPGHGTTFQVYLPIFAGETSVQEPMGNIRPTPHGTERILLVDDEVSIVQIMQKILERLGYQVTALSNCEEAIRIFMNHPEAFDLVITDMNMPKVMGTDLARTFLETRPDIPIILCTGFSEKIDSNRAKSLGIREFLYKPVEKNTLARLVRKILDEHKTEEKPTT